MASSPYPALRRFAPRGGAAPFIVHRCCETCCAALPVVAPLCCALRRGRMRRRGGGGLLALHSSAALSPFAVRLSPRAPFATRGSYELRQALSLVSPILSRALKRACVVIRNKFGICNLFSGRTNGDSVSLQCWCVRARCRECRRRGGSERWCCGAARRGISCPRVCWTRPFHVLAPRRATVRTG